MKKPMARARTTTKVSPDEGLALAPGADTAPEPGPNLVEVTVSELSNALKRTLEDAYGYVRVRGELGKVSYHSNGHVYFDLKDDRACIAGVVWRTSAQRLRVRLEPGLEVVCTGRITTYPGRSQYQIIVDTVAPAGLGALMALVEERKRKLETEGLFDPARKQLLPYLPGVVGVVTSPTGAVIRDILHRLADRFPRRVLVWPVRVQGEDSAQEVAAAIRGFNALPERGRIPRPDVIIVARGGGSLEDLWSFNDEAVVRAAAESMIPLISAVGHETDVTLIDYAADRRAPTPTAAAEMAVPVRSELIAQVDDLARRGFASWRQRHERRRGDLRALVRVLPAPERLLDEPRQRLDLAAGGLLRGLRTNAERHRAKFVRLGDKLAANAPGAAVKRMREQVRGLTDRTQRARARMFLRPRERLLAAGERLSAALRANRSAHLTRLAHQKAVAATLSARLGPAFDGYLDRRYAALDRAAGLLEAFSYHGVLARGFTLVRDRDGRPLRTAAAVGPGLNLDIEFADGRVPAVATGGGASAPPEPPRRRRRRGASDPGQGSLFGE
jgi:exodeoxyribonuclease VII large subunit